MEAEFAREEDSPERGASTGEDSEMGKPSQGRRAASKVSSAEARLSCPGCQLGGSLGSGSASIPCTGPPFSPPWSTRDSCHQGWPQHWLLLSAPLSSSPTLPPLPSDSPARWLLLRRLL